MINKILVSVLLFTFLTLFISVSSVAAFTSNLPVGQSGNWQMVFEDNFDGTTLDTTKWAASWYGDGGSMNNVGTYASNVSVAGGNLILTLASANSGALVNTQSNNGFEVKVGMYSESRIYFPGNGTKLYNWPAWWLSGTPWPNAGEHDIAEVLGGSLTVNYHSPSGSHNQGAPAGYWGDSFHTYGILRKSNSAEVYWDGKLVKSYQTDDNGAGEDLILNVGAGSPSIYGAASQVKVDYVRVWQPSTSSTASPVPTFNSSDQEPDGDVDYVDFNILVSKFGLSGVVGWIRSDIIKDGVVNIFDFNKLITNFGL